MFIVLSIIKFIGGIIVDMILVSVLALAFILVLPMWVIFGIGRCGTFREYLSACGFFNAMESLGAAIDRVNSAIRF